MASSSTNSGRKPEGWSLDEIPDLALAGMLGIPGDRVQARRAELEQQQREPAWVEAALEALPAATLSILQLLAECGGIAVDTDLAREAQARYRLREDQYRHAVLPAIRAVLAVPLSTRDSGTALALVQPAAKLVTPQVIDLDVAPLPLTAFVPGAPAAPDPRSFLALCIATRHVDLKLTKGGAFHFGAVKRLARQLGIDERVADEGLRVALGLKLVAPDGEFVRPDLEALVAAAQGQYSALPGVTALQGLLASGPILSDAARRWCARRRLSHVAEVISDISCLPGFATGTVDDEVALSYRAPDGSASAHITPSFEVILPPESRLIDIVQVGACCDWVRLDRALVARITKPAVGRAVAAGARPEQILGWLASASQRPIPQNVEVAIRDWAGAVIPATLATGHVVVVDAAAESHALAALDKLAARRIAPGVLVVGSAVPAREVSKALLAAGIQVDAGAPARLRPATTASPTALKLGAVRLRGKVGAWLRGEPFEGVRDTYLDNIGVPGAVSSKATRTPAMDPLSRLAEWAATHRVNDNHVFDRLLDGPLAGAIAELSTRDIDRLLSSARNLDDLVAAVARLLTQRGPSLPASPPLGAPRAGRTVLTLRWEHDQLRHRLEAVADGAQWVALDLGGTVRFVEIERVVRRGSMWFVLGEDLDDGTAVALAVDQIKALAVLPDDFDLGELLASEHAPPIERAGPTGPWRPAPGTPAPPGHVACPCGSGERYRNCCRRVIQA